MTRIVREKYIVANVMNLSTKQENEAKIIKDLRVDSDDEDTVIVRHSYDILHLCNPLFVE